MYLGCLTLNISIREVVCGGVGMGWLRYWSVESKEFKFSIKNGSSVLTIQERRRGVQRAVNLRKKEQVWLARTFGELVAVEDSQVFRDQTAPGRPRVLAQKCGNRNGRFLVLEEYNDRGKCRPIFVPEGRDRQGWNRFIEELRYVIQPSAHSWEIPMEKRRYSEELLDTTKEERRNPVAIPANSQGKDLKVMGDHAFSGSANKCLSVQGKEKYVREASFCCAGCVSVGGRGHLLEYLEALPVEFSKCIGKLKSCYCLQHCGQEGNGPKTQEATKEAHISTLEMDKGLEENNWAVKEKKQRRIKEKGLLPRPNSSWVAGRTGFGPVGSRKATDSSLHKGGTFGLSASLGPLEQFSSCK